MLKAYTHASLEPDSIFKVSASGVGWCRWLHIILHVVGLKVSASGVGFRCRLVQMVSYYVIIMLLLCCRALGDGFSCRL